ncbi:hypothetical protein [Oricola sp.]|uniref:hypothetical protein n=1 Tax=Oricola sp. TaxID=1979950 RepID=UPI0035149659
MSRKCPARKRPPARWRLSGLASIFAAFGLAAMALATAPAAANDDAPLKKGGFQLWVNPDVLNGTVSVKTNPSGTWIDPTPVKLHLTGKVDFKRRSGYIERAGLFAGHCRRTACGSNTLLWFRSESQYTGPEGTAIELPDNDWYFGFGLSVLPQRLLDSSLQAQVIQRCENNPMDSFTVATIVTLSLNTRTQVRIGTQFKSISEEVDIDEVEFNGGDQSRHASLFLPVMCETLSHVSSTPTPFNPPNPTFEFDHGAMKVDDIRLTLTTYSNAYTEPNPGTKCKKAKLAVTLETNQEGPVSFKLWEQRGDGQIESEVVNATAHHDDGHSYAVHERWIEVDETTHVQFNARDLVNETFYNETGWKDITLNCTGAGGGGLQVAPEDDHGVAQTAFEGKFQFIDNGPQAQNYTCPRNPKALVWFDAPKQDNIHYSLDCGALGNFSGVLQPEKIANGHYRAGKLINMELTDTIEAGCTLRTVSPGDARDHAFAAHTFQCAKTAGFSDDIGGLTVDEPTPDNDIPTPTPRPKVNPAVGAAVGGLTAEPRPTHTPTVPEKKTAPIRVNPEPPAPMLVCNGGKIIRGECACGPNKLRRKIGATAYQCVAVAPPPPEPKKPLRVTPAPKKQVQLVCKGGKVANGKCLCGSSAKRVKIGQNAFACQKKQAVRTNPEPKKKAIQSKRVTPKAKKTSLVCKGGKASKGKCLCGKKKTAKKLGPNRFACVAKRS